VPDQRGRVGDAKNTEGDDATPSGAEGS